MAEPVMLITGCSSGIGFEAALRFARKGWRVFATLRDPAKAGPLRRAARGLPLEVLRLDVDRPASVARALAHIRRKAGRLDLLLNNAGYGAFGALEDFTDQEVSAQYQTNVLGLMRVTRAALPLMRAAGGGRILNLGSLAGRMTFAGICLYCSSKHAVEALTEALRVELRPFGIEVAVVEPGAHHTAFKDNRRKNAAFRQGKSVYQAVLEKILEFGDRRSSQAPGAEAVVDAIEKALGARVLRARCPVGRDARFYPLVRWCLPEALWDLLMDRVSRKFQPPAPRAFQPPPGAPVALVTGATSGFGFETAALLAQAGWRVYATYRHPRKTADLRRLAKRTGRVFPLFLDLDRPATVKKTVDDMLRREGRLDLLVNNAGFVMAGFLGDLSDGELRAQFETNLFGTLRVTRAALPQMRRQGWGRIVNLGSISGRVAFPGLGAYAASKFALRSISEGLRRETAPFGIQVAEIAPGSYGTKVFASTRYGAQVKSAGSPFTPFTREVEKLVGREFAKARPPREVAAIILEAARAKRMRPVYLAGPDARFLNFAKWLLPDGVFEGLLGLAFPWSRPPNP